jgi:hypothetical protein
VGSGGERHEHGQPCEAAVPDVGHREDAEREHGKVEREQRHDELPVDAQERVERHPGCETKKARAPSAVIPSRIRPRLRAPT